MFVQLRVLLVSARRMKMQPVILLDVDGVLNAIARKGDPAVWPEWKSGYARAGDGVWPILWSPAVAAFFREVHASGAAEIRWHTTWQHAAVEIERLLDLPALAVAEAPEYHDRRFGAMAIREGKPPWWKHPAAERVVLEEKRQLIWLDDDLRWELQRYDTTSLSGALLICPKQHIGLTPAHLKMIEEAL
jgi:Swiss Army Knife RNA repair-like protein